MSSTTVITRTSQDQQNGESSSASSSSSSSQPQPKCTYCQSPPAPDHSLKPCLKCQSVHYCKKECQKADFKMHKKDCARLAQIWSQSADIKMEKPRGTPKEGFRGGLQKWQFDT